MCRSGRSNPFKMSPNHQGPSIALVQIQKKYDVCAGSMRVKGEDGVFLVVAACRSRLFGELLVVRMVLWPTQP
jgi:hypothetical protein